MFACVQVGLKGEVLVTFDENKTRVGVRFDEVVPGGNSLGIPEQCEETHGFFVDCSDLRLLEEKDSSVSLDQLSIRSLLEVASAPSEAKENQPCIVCIRDVNALMACNYERFDNFKEALAGLPDSSSIMIIGLSTR